MPRSFYVTTPIYYVNDRPHIGHAYTTVAADALARYHRLLGDRVHFLTGTDEHGQKVYEAARKRGLSPQEHVDRMSRPFRELWERLEISHDDFIRTTEPRHVAVVQRVLQELYDRGEIYKASYSGWYSTAAERFWTEKDLVDGRCPETGQPVEWITEENYFFRMGKYQERLLRHIEEHPDFIRPESRRNEVLGYLKKPLEDLCITRPASRLPWGVPLPFDPDYVTYVWFDALLNYVSALGYPDGELFHEFWPADYHLVGKDILTTHAVYWTTMLFAMGVPPVRTLYAHGWWKVEGRKMSKSLRNTVDPHLLLDAYGPDAVRYFLLREVPFGLDGNWSHDSFLTRYNADLANDLGNLVHRSLSMTGRWLGGRVPPRGDWGPDEQRLAELARETVGRYRAAFEAAQFHEALAAVWRLVQAGNKYLDSQQPWTLNREGRRERLATVMRAVLELCRVAGVLVSPVMPGKARELLAKLGAGLPDGLDGLAELDALEEGRGVSAGTPLFPRMSELPASIREALERAAGSAKQEPPAAKKARKSSKSARKEPAPGGKGSAPGLVSIDEFSRVQLRVGQVLSAEKHPKADRLYVLKVDLGEAEPRTIVAGLAAHYAAGELVGRKVVVVANLKPAKLRGIRSEGMLLAATGEGFVRLLEVDAPPGAAIG